ncbi:MAG: sigma-70 family RNA polymerase sigma factor [Deltaproteobacteria bacterium]|nr:sigma-70 family RNA polymerase sigma factor [Deltaproteobacteria bacterium]
MTDTSARDARSRLLAELAQGPARRGYSIAYDLLGNRSEAEEAVQEGLARACESIGDLRDPGAAPAWFLRIVTSVCLRHLRRRRLKRTLFGRFGWTEPRDDESPATSAAADEGPEALAALTSGAALPLPTEALASRQELAIMLRTLEGLSAQQRTALVLRYGHDLPVPEVAQMLGVELATAKTHLVRGLAKLRDLMEEHR